MPATPSTQLLTKFRKITFELTADGIPFYIQTFTINPEELTREDQASVTVTRTLGGIHVDDFGLGVITYNLRGTTGYHAKVSAEGRLVDGYIEFKNLRDRVYRYFLEPTGVHKDRLTTTYGMIFHDWSMNEHYWVQPIGKFQLSRNKSRPLLFAYDFTFVVLRPTNYRDPSIDRIYQNVTNAFARISDVSLALAQATNLGRILTYYVPRK